MNALTSHGIPRFGFRLDSGTISAPARHARPAPKANVISRTLTALMPRPRASGSFMITARV
jgi:hypothetical protein